MRYKRLHKKSYPKKDLYKKRLNKSAGINHIQDSINEKFLSIDIEFDKYIDFKITEPIEVIDLHKEKLKVDDPSKISINTKKLLKILTIGLITTISSVFLINNSYFDTESTVKESKTLMSTIVSNPTTTVKTEQKEITTTSSTTTTTLLPTVNTTIPLIIIETIEEAQIELKKLYIYQGNIDGVNGTYTKLSIKEFQRRSGLKIDGVLGPNTKLALSKGADAYVILGGQETVDISDLEISEETKDLQKKLKDLNIYTGDIDGIYGFQTVVSLKEFQRKAGLKIDGVYGPNTKSSLEKGEDSYVTVEITKNENNNSNNKPVITSTDTKLTVDLQNYNPSGNCITGYVNVQNIWVPDPCFLPVFVFRYGNVAQVNSQAELDAYLNQNWSLTKEKTYTSLGKVPTQNYTDGYNSPVNGLPMPSGSNNSIVIGIKNDNNVRARPQSGPQSADAVVEVLVEGGMTRFINIFYQSDTDYHGPIRSARPTDPTVLRPVGGVLVASGATGGLIPEIVDMGVPVITDRRPEYFRISSRNAPHNLYADTAKLKQLAVNRGYKKYTNPQPLFPWGNPSQSNWSINSYLTLTFSSYTNTTWRWNGSSYVRTYYDAYKNSSSDNLHYWIDKNSNQGQITTTTVIALFCEPYTHPLQLPSVKTVGEGRAIILHNGKMLDARWKRGSNLDPFHIVDKSGNILYVPKGKVWISLVPNTKNPSFG